MLLIVNFIIKRLEYYIIDNKDILYYNIDNKDSILQQEKNAVYEMDKLTPTVKIDVSPG